MRNTRRLSKTNLRGMAVLALAAGMVLSNVYVSSSASSQFEPENAPHYQKAIDPDSPLNHFYEHGEGINPTLSGISGTAATAPLNPVCNAQNDACIWEDNSTPGPLGCRVPLIFVHGIHGNKIGGIDDPKGAPNTSYFRSLIRELTNSSKSTITTNYKIYRFHYKSDVNYVQTIGWDLAKLLDTLISNDPNFDKEFMIVAHSMGGLVARAYMNFRHKAGGSDSRYKGKLAGDRVLKLITLGTPHHGSQLSNGGARTSDAFLGSPWDAVLRVVDTKYWTSLACITYDICLELPNRRDLHWDNYDGAWSIRRSYKDNSREQNPLLQTLPATYDNKIYPYYGYIGDGKIFKRESDIVRFGQGWSEIKANVQSALSHKGLGALGVILERIDKANFNPLSRVSYLYNDGMVTFESAGFSKSSAFANRRSCPGYDHLDMRDGAPFNCKAGSVQKPLVQLVIDDLRLNSPLSCAPKPVVSTSLRLAQGNGPFGVGQKLDGTFSVTNRGNANLVMKQVLIGGRVAGACPNNVCPDFTPVPSNITLAPGQTYNYSGSLPLQRNGSYTFTVAYQKPDGSWVNPVDPENGTINKLNITVQSAAPKPVVSASLRLAQGNGPFGVGQKLDGSFSITNRGKANLVMKQVLIGGRIGGACPNNVCPDFTPVPSNVTIAPGKTYNYSGSLSLPRNGTYTLTVAYQKPDGSWVNPVDPENGTINKLNITVQSAVSKPVVSTSLRLAQGKGPFRIGQKLDGSFSITNRGNANLAMKQVLIGGRVDHTCPNNVCPDFEPIPRGITLAPGQTFNYSGTFYPQRTGIYTLYVACQRSDGKWEMPVDSENGTTNTLNVTVQGEGPTLTGISPVSPLAGPNAQTVYLSGTRLADTTYCHLQLPNGRIVVYWVLRWEIFSRRNNQLGAKIKFPVRGRYYISAKSRDGLWSNALRIVVN